MDGVPGQPSKIAVTVYVTVCGELVELVRVCAGMVSFPLGETPDIPAGAEAVQEIEAPGVEEVMVTGWVVVSLQMVWLFKLNATTGTGFTQTIPVSVRPVQLLAEVWTT